MVVFLTPSALLPVPKPQTARPGGGPAKDAASGGVSDDCGASGLPAPRVGGEQQVSDPMMTGGKSVELCLLGMYVDLFGRLGRLRSGQRVQQITTTLTALTSTSVYCHTARIETDGGLHLLHGG